MNTKPTEVCRFCLKTVSDQFFNAVNKNERKMLHELIPDLNLNVTKNIFICSSCARDLQLSYDFKQKYFCDNAAELPSFSYDGTTASVEVNKVIQNKNVNLAGVVEVPQTCCICKQLIERGFFMSLNERTENNYRITVLRKHIPGLNLSATKELATCEACLSSLQFLLIFIFVCLDVEEKVTKYITIKGSNRNGYIMLTDVQKFTSEHRYDNSHPAETESHYKEAGYSVIVDTEGSDDVLEVYDTKLSEHDDDEVEKIERNKESKEHNSKEEVTEKKVADLIEVHDTELICMYKIDETESEVEENSKRKDERFKQTLPSLQSETECQLVPEDSLGIPVCKDKTCTYETKVEHTGNQIPVDRDAFEAINYRHDIWANKIKYENPIKKHLATSYQCEECEYETVNERDLKKHKLVHQYSFDFTADEYQELKNKTKCKEYIEERLLLHKVFSHTTIYQCELCKYKTKLKHRLKSHMLLHKDSSEVIMYQCYTCGFQSKNKPNMRDHILAHEGPSRAPDLTPFTCEICGYKTRFMKVLKDHMVVH